MVGFCHLTDSHHYHHGQKPTMVGICHGGNLPLGPHHELCKSLSQSGPFMALAESKSDMLFLCQKRKTSVLWRKTMRIHDILTNLSLWLRVRLIGDYPDKGFMHYTSATTRTTAIYANMIKTYNKVCCCPV